jgi:hypothetical protein
MTDLYVTYSTEACAAGCTEDLYVRGNEPLPNLGKKIAQNSKKIAKNRLKSRITALNGWFHRDLGIFDLL